MKAFWGFEPNLLKCRPPNSSTRDVQPFWHHNMTLSFIDVLDCSHSALVLKMLLLHNIYTYILVILLTDSLKYLYIFYIKDAYYITHTNSKYHIKYTNTYNIYFCNDGSQIQGLTHSKQIIYHWVTPTDMTSFSCRNLTQQ